jgi:predicted nuclease with TOPRIM domain
LIGFAEVGDYFKAKENKRRAKEIKAQLDARFKEAEKMALYRKLAETDATMKELLTELDSLEVDKEEDEEEVTF